MVRLVWTAALMGVWGCGVDFTGGEAAGTAAPASGGHAGAEQTTGTGGSGASGGEGASGGGGNNGTGGMGGAPPTSLTVCANDDEYGLNGAYMEGHDDKLVNPASFGPGAPVAMTLELAWIESNAISEAELNAKGCDIFHIGLTESDVWSGTTYASMTQGQVAALRNWSLTPGHVVLGSQGFASEWGPYAGSSNVYNPMVAPPSGSPMFDGPFGDPTSVYQGGSWQGIYDTLPSGQFCPLMQDSVGAVVAFSDRLTGDVFLSDVDIITTLGGASAGDAISTANDQVFANLYALLVHLAVGKITDPCP